jgi:hypothetical protein
MKNFFGTISTLFALVRFWFNREISYPIHKIIAIYAAGLVAFVGGWVVGFCGPMVRQTGWVFWVVVVLVALHMAVALFSRKPSKGNLNWLEKLDGSIVDAGFIGKLYGIAVVTKAVVVSGDPAAAQAGLGQIAHGVSVALFSTICGLVIARWTHCVTIVYSNYLDSQS